jgi:hypothetical protein
MDQIRGILGEEQRLVATDDCEELGRVYCECGAGVMLSWNLSLNGNYSSGGMNFGNWLYTMVGSFARN